MAKYIITLCILVISNFCNYAQELLVKTINLKPYLEHTIVNNQSIFFLSKTYNLSLAEIADNNNELYKKGFKNGDVVIIPVNVQNYLSKPEPGSLPLYYIVENNENLAILSKRLNILPSMLQTWNNLPSPKLENGQKIIIGWIKYNKVESYRKGTHQGSIWDNKTIIDEHLDNNSTSTGKTLKLQYESIEIKEQQVNGLAVFYNNNALNQSNTIFAFHNNLPKGTIVKVCNPIDQNINIFATILGTIPKLDQYLNAAIVLSNNAKDLLQVEVEPFYCNIFYK